MGGERGVEARGARSVCEFVKSERAAAVARLPIDEGTTRTDFARTDPKDSRRFLSRFIDPSGRFTDTQRDGVETDAECYQAAIRLGEIAAGRFGSRDLTPAAWKRGKPAAPRAVLQFLQEADVRVFWNPTDPLQYRESGASAAKIAQRFVKKADEIWRGTKSIKDLTARRRAFAKALFDKMSRPTNAGGFGITFFDPNASKIDKKDHALYSSQLDCFGSWLYGLLCRRFGIEATPVQRFTDELGRSIDHVLVGVSLNPKKPQELTLVSFHPGERRFDVQLWGKSTWAPISQLELLAHVHMKRAHRLYPHDRVRQREELDRALRYAPHNYLVHYLMAAWYCDRADEMQTVGKKREADGMKQKALEHLQRSYELNPTYQPTLTSLRSL